MSGVQVTAALLGLALSGTILMLMRRDHLHGAYAIFWLVLALFATLFGLYPKLIDHIASAAGISYPPVLLILIAIVLILIRLLSVDIERSKQEVKLRRITQKIALLEHELDRQRADEQPAADDASAGR
jgi:hypothetical protein